MQHSVLSFIRLLSYDYQRSSTVIGQETVAWQNQIAIRFNRDI